MEFCGVNEFVFNLIDRKNSKIVVEKYNQNQIDRLEISGNDILPWIWVHTIMCEGVREVKEKLNENRQQKRLILRIEYHLLFICVCSVFIIFFIYSTTDDGWNGNVAKRGNPLRIEYIKRTNELKLLLSNDIGR